MSQHNPIEAVIKALYKDASNDHFKMMRGRVRSIFRPMQPSDFKDVYLAISPEQGDDLVKLIQDNNIKEIVEFGTSFGISTLYLAKGIINAGGKITTTELLPSKAKVAGQNFKKAGVEDLIDLRVGDAMQTLTNFDQFIDLLFLDGWKDLYSPLFHLLEPNFHSQTLVYVDNADMPDSQDFLQEIAQKTSYTFKYIHGGKAALITRS